MTIMGCKRELKLSNFGLNHEDPRAFVTSQWECPRIYLLWRFFWAIFHTFWLVTSIAVSQVTVTSSSVGGAVWMIYLTNWTYLLLTISAVLDAVVATYVKVKRQDILKGCPTLLPWYMKVSWVINNIVNEGSIHISLFYWIFIFKYQKLTVLRFILHAVNSIYVLCNHALTAMPVRVYHVIHPLIYGAIYTVFTVIYQTLGATNNKGESFIYKITDWTKPGRTLSLVCLSTFVFLPCIHVFIYLLYMFKVYIYSKLKGLNGRSLDPSREITGDEPL